MTTKPLLTIGKLAAAADVTVETVRYYQRRGLIDEPARPAQGFRIYPQKTLEHIQFIKRAKGLGFSLSEIADLLKLGTKQATQLNTRNGHCSDIRAHAESKRDKINQQIHNLELLRDSLDKLILSCHSSKNEQACPIIESLLEQDN